MNKPDFSTMDRAQLCSSYNEMIDSCVSMGQSPATYRKMASFTHGIENGISRCEKLWSVVQTMQDDKAKPKDENRPEVSPVMGEHAAADLTDETFLTTTGEMVEPTKPVVYKDVALVLKENAVTKSSKTKKSSTKAAKPAKAKTVKAKGNGKSSHGVRAGSKTEIIHGLLTRKGGCTAADVLKATGWPSVSMNAMSKACGLKLHKEKVKGERTRYSGS